MDQNIVDEITYSNYLPIGWLKAKIGDICTKLVGGGTPPRNKTDYFGGNIIWLTPTEISKNKIIEVLDSKERLTNLGLKNSSCTLIPKDSVLLTSRATIGSVAIAGCDLTTNQGFASFICSNAIYNYYLAHWLSGNKDLLESNAKGTTFKEISKSILKEIIIPLPPLNEQKRIVSKLEELFTKLDSQNESLKKIQILLKQYRQSVLKYAFEGKLTEKWRKDGTFDIQTDKIGNWERERLNNFVKDFREFFKKNPNEKSLLPIEVKYINLDKPEEWIGITLESACTFVIDCPHSTPKFTHTGKYCIDTTCIKNSKIIWSEARTVSEKEFRERNVRMKPQENDILFAREGTIGTTVKVPVNSEFCLGQRIMMFRFAPFVLPQYAEFFMQSPVFIYQYRPLILGTSSPHLNVRDIRKLVIYVPTQEEQIKIVKILDFKLSIINNISENIYKNIIQSRILKKQILKNAFEGKLVHQDPEDEPASVTLENVKLEEIQ